MISIHGQEYGKGQVSISVKRWKLSNGTLAALLPATTFKAVYLQIA